MGPRRRSREEKGYGKDEERRIGEEKGEEKGKKRNIVPVEVEVIAFV